MLCILEISSVAYNAIKVNGIVFTSQSVETLYHVHLPQFLHHKFIRKSRKKLIILSSLMTLIPYVFCLGTVIPYYRPIIRQSDSVPWCRGT